LKVEEKRREREEELEYYGETLKSRFSEKVRAANWLPLIFYSGLATISSFLLLYIGINLGPPTLFFFIGLTGFVDLLCIFMIKKFGWPGSIITDSCVDVGSRLVCLQFDDGRAWYTPADVYFDLRVGEDGFIPFKNLGEYLPPEAIEALNEVFQEENIDQEENINQEQEENIELRGGIMKLHIKSDWGPDASGVYYIQMPDHIINIKSPFLFFKVTPIGYEIVNGRKFKAFAGGLATQLIQTGKDNYLDELPRIAEVLVGLVRRDEYQELLEEKQAEIDALNKRINRLIQLRERMKMLDEAEEESGGVPKKWYEIPVVRWLIEFAVIIGLAILFIKFGIGGIFI